MIKRCLIIIDGSNFYFKLKDLKLNDLINFDFGHFAIFLAGDYEVIGAKYYVGKVRQDGTKKVDKLLADQQKLFVNLKKHNFEYSLGFLLKSNNAFHEKGVDVQMAIDMITAAYENLCEKIILVSSDTDLSPAIKKTQEKGKIVEYVGFSHKTSVAMVRFCKESRVLSKQDILSFVR